jgi:alkaline phosphatase D
MDPQAFIFLGDNVYSEVNRYSEYPKPERVAMAYQDLEDRKPYKAFKEASYQKAIKIFSVWDDNDYGENDAGREFAYRDQSKTLFLDFFEIPDNAPVRMRPGNYRAGELLLDHVRVQVLMLDTRYFRSPLKYHPGQSACNNHLIENTDAEATILGDAQWFWLEQQLKQPADLRLIISSIQLIPKENCYEKWANFPAERKRLFDLIKMTRAEGVLILSGDRHFAEISKLPSEYVGYPIYEVTSSGLNKALNEDDDRRYEKNSFRVAKHNILEDNFGNIRVISSADGVELKMEIRADDGLLLQSEKLMLQSLRLQ